MKGKINIVRLVELVIHIVGMINLMAWKLIRKLHNARVDRDKGRENKIMMISITSIINRIGFINDRLQLILNMKN